MKIGLIRGKEPKSKIVVKPQTLLKAMGIMALAGAAVTAAVMTKKETSRTDNESVSYTHLNREKVSKFPVYYIMWKFCGSVL